MRLETVSKRMVPTFDSENHLYQQGYTYIAGVDEVGRGAWAGPIVAGAVILPKNFPCLRWKLKESKQLTPKSREKFFHLITAQAIAYAVYILDNTYIDQNGISKANMRVLMESAKTLNPKPDYVLFDFFNGNFSFDTPFKMTPHGDRCIASIAAASVIAKVTRDRIMKELGGIYPQYKFENHKGYGTSLHQEKLHEYGVSPIHRKSYRPIKDILTKHA